MARKQKTIHYLYKTTCLVTERYYIGMHSTCNLDDGYMGSGKRLKYSIRKYGVDNHKKEIIEFFETRELLIEAEKKAITPEMITDKNCMNLKEGGFGGFSVEQQKLNAIKSNNKQKLLKETNPEWLKQKSEKISIGNKKAYDSGQREKKYFYDWTNKKHTEETKKIISEKNSTKQQGYNNSQYGTCWITNEKENKKIYKGDLIPSGWRLGRKMKI